MATVGLTSPQILAPVTVKARLEDDIRWFRFDGTDCFAKLQQTLTNTFNVNKQVGLRVKYIDDENDEITMSSDMELFEAIRLARLWGNGVLRLMVSSSDLSMRNMTISASTTVSEEATSPQQFSSEGVVEEAAKSQIEEAFSVVPDKMEQAVEPAEGVLEPQILPAVPHEEERDAEPAEAAVEALPAPPLLPVATFIEHVTIVPGTEVVVNTPFRKLWRVRNSGSTPWPSGCRIVHVSGDALAREEPCPLGSVAPDESVIITVALLAPGIEGSFEETWQLQTADGTAFGPLLSAAIDTVFPEPPAELRRSILSLPSGASSYQDLSAVSTTLPRPSLMPARVEVITPPSSIGGEDRSVISTDDERHEEEWIMLTPRDNSYTQELPTPPLSPKLEQSDPVQQKQQTEPVDEMHGSGECLNEAQETLPASEEPAAVANTTVDEDVPYQLLTSVSSATEAEPFSGARIAPHVPRYQEPVLTATQQEADVLARLIEMGFIDSERNLRLLRESNGDLTQVIDALTL